MSSACLMYSGSLLQCVAAVYVNPQSPRVFFLLKGAFKVMPLVVDLLVVLRYVIVFSFV